MEIKKIEDNFNPNDAYLYYANNKHEISKFTLIRILFVMVYYVLELSESYISGSENYGDKIKEVYNFSYNLYCKDLDFLFLLWRLSIIDESYFSLSKNDTDFLINNNNNYFYHIEMVKFGLYKPNDDTKILFSKVDNSYNSSLGKFSEYCNQFIGH